MKYTFIILLMLAGSAIAEGELASNEYQDVFGMSIEELTQMKITVSSFHEETRLEAASSVYSVDENAWQSYGAKNLLDLLQHQAGSKAYTTLAGSPALSVRGFTNSLSVVRGHAIIIDGVSHNSYSRGSGVYSSTLFDLNLMERVELLRGPASVLYGSDAFHSVVSVKSWSPEKDALELGTRAGSFGYSSSFLRGSEALELPSIGRVRITTGVSFNYSHDAKVPHDYFDQTSGALVQQFNREKVNKKSFLFKLNNDRLIWVSHYLDAETDEFVGLTQIQGSNQEGRRSSARRNDVWFSKLSYNHDINQDLSLDASFSYLVKDVFTDFDIGGSIASPAPNSLTLGLALPDEKATYTLELKNDVDKKLSWSTGFEVTRHDISGAVRTTSSNPDVFSDSDYEDFNRDVYSIYANSKYRFSEKSQIVAGLRADEYDDLDYLATTPRLGLVHFPRKDTAIKLLYGQAFRAPAAIEEAGGTTILGGFDIEPEIMKTTELVLMRTTQKYEESLTLFYSDWQDGIRLEETEAALAMGKETQYVNAAKNLSYGIEFELKRTFAGRNLVLLSNGSIVKSQNKDNETDYVAFPTYIFNWGGSWRLTDSKWTLSVYNRHEFDRRATVTESSQKLESYFRTDLALNWQGSEKLEASLNIIDLFNRENINPSPWNRSLGQSEVGLDVSASVNYRF